MVSGTSGPRAGLPGNRANPLRAQIVSDGTQAGTHVFLADGTELTQAQSITWSIDASTAEAVLTVRLGMAGIRAEGRLDVQAGVTPHRT